MAERCESNLTCSLSRRGFTLVELLVVLGLIVLLTMITVPVVGPLVQSRQLESAVGKLQAVLMNARALAAKHDAVYHVTFNTVEAKADSNPTANPDFHWYAVVGPRTIAWEGIGGNTISTDPLYVRLGPFGNIADNGDIRDAEAKEDDPATPENERQRGFHHAQVGPIYILPPEVCFVTENEPTELYAAWGWDGDFRISFTPIGDAIFFKRGGGSFGTTMGISLRKRDDVNENMPSRIFINQYTGLVETW